MKKKLFIKDGELNTQSAKLMEMLWRQALGNNFWTKNLTQSHFVTQSDEFHCCCGSQALENLLTMYDLEKFWSLWFPDATKMSFSGYEVTINYYLPILRFFYRGNFNMLKSWRGGSWVSIFSLQPAFPSL